MGIGPYLSPGNPLGSYPVPQVPVYIWIEGTDGAGGAGAAVRGGGILPGEA